jgi:hypothetical protein
MRTDTKCALSRCRVILSQLVISQIHRNKHYGIADEDVSETPLKVHPM